MKTAILQTSESVSSPSGTASKRCSVENDNISSQGSGCHDPVCSSSSAPSISSFEGLRPVALSLFTNITCPSAGDTITPSSLGIGRSGSLQKLAKNAANISIKTPNPGARPYRGLTNHPTRINPTPINVGVITGRNPPLANIAK